MNIAHLKAKILDLAVRGKLTEQRPEEGSAEELLERIREEKQRLIAEGKLKKEKPLPDITEDEIPFNIPVGWKWVRLGEICDYGKCENANPSQLQSDSWILDLEDIEKGTARILRFYTFSQRNSQSTKHIFKKGDVLYSKLRPYLNKVVIAPQDGFCTSEILPLDFQGAYYNSFAQKLLMSPYFLSTVNMLTYGVKMPRLGKDDAVQILLPLPPLAEQKRIVEKIEQIFRQADTIEQNRLALKTAVRHTKSRVLDLAVRGKLTEQRPEEGSAEELLERIREEKQRLIAEGKLKKEKPLPEITEDEIPFDIPAGWKWVRLGEIGTWQAGCTPDTTRKDFYENGTIPWINSADLTDGYIDTITHYVTEKAFAEKKMRLNKTGAVCVAMYGATIGKTGILTVDATTNQAVCVCNLLSSMDSKYLFYFLQFHKPFFVMKGFGGAQPNISKEKIENTPFPLPLLAEQKRIAEKIEQIFGTLDIIEKAVE